MEVGHEKTGFKDNNIEKRGVKLLFEKFDTLKKADDDFNSFLEVVSKDIATKTERLKKVKVSSDFGYTYMCNMVVVSDTQSGGWMYFR